MENLSTPIAQAEITLKLNTSNFKPALQKALNSPELNKPKNVTINPMIDDIKLRQNAMRVQNQYMKVAGEVRNAFAGVGAVGIGLGKSAITSFLKTDSAEASNLRLKIAKLGDAWAGVGGKLNQASIGGKTLSQWIDKLASGLNGLSVEKIERIAKAIAFSAAIAGGIQFLRVLEGIKDTFERIGILKDRATVIRDRQSQRDFTSSPSGSGGYSGGSSFTPVMAGSFPKISSITDGPSISPRIAPQYFQITKELDALQLDLKKLVEKNIKIITSDIKNLQKRALGNLGMGTPLSAGGFTIQGLQQELDEQKNKLLAINGRIAEQAGRGEVRVRPWKFRSQQNLSDIDNTVPLASSKQIFAANHPTMAKIGRYGENVANGFNQLVSAMVHPITSFKRLGNKIDTFGESIGSLGKLSIGLAAGMGVYGLTKSLIENSKTAMGNVSYFREKLGIGKDYYIEAAKQENKNRLAEHNLQNILAVQEEEAILSNSGVKKDYSAWEKNKRMGISEDDPRNMMTRIREIQNRNEGRMEKLDKGSQQYGFWAKENSGYDDMLKKLSDSIYETAFKNLEEYNRNTKSRDIEREVAGTPETMRNLSLGSLRNSTQKKDIGDALADSNTNLLNLKKGTSAYNLELENRNKLQDAYNSLLEEQGKITNNVMKLEKDWFEVGKERQLKSMERAQLEKDIKIEEKKAKKDLGEKITDMTGNNKPLSKFAQAIKDQLKEAMKIGDIQKINDIGELADRDTLTSIINKKQGSFSSMGATELPNFISNLINNAPDKSIQMADVLRANQDRLSDLHDPDSATNRKIAKLKEEENIQYLSGIEQNTLEMNTAINALNKSVQELLKNP